MSNQRGGAALRLLNFVAMTLTQDCALCGASIDALVCPRCVRALPHLLHACARCALPIPSNATFCGACLKRDAHAFDDAIAAFEYRFPVDRLVQRFKYSGDLAMGRWLAGSLARAVARRPRPDLLVAPPLANAGLRRRGFNQALVVARHVARELRVRCDIDAIRKMRETPNQQGLDRRQRLRNLRDAFACERRFDGLHVAIVDDVLTTCATADILARLLRERGAARVSAWAIARTPDPALR